MTDRTENLRAAASAGPPAVTSGKRELRADASARRRRMCPDYRSAAADELCELVLRLPDPTVATVAMHVSVGFEPSTRPLLAALREAGTRVLLPVVLADLSLDWAAYDGPDELTPGPRGIPEPTGPRLGRDAIGQADLVLVPGLLADRAGNRLGRGGGSYDRALPLRRPGVPAFVLLYPVEIVDELPAEPHDAPVDAALTPDGLVLLGRRMDGSALGEQ